MSAYDSKGNTMNIKLLLLAIVLVLTITACSYGDGTGDYPYGHPCNDWQAPFTPDACPPL